MLTFRNEAVLSRRRLLSAGAGIGLLAISDLPVFGASDFWNKKPSSDWSVDEVEMIKTKSPWAKKVRGEMPGGGFGNRGGGADSMSGQGRSGGMGGITGADSSGGGESGGGGRRGGRGGGGGDAGFGGGQSAGASQGPEVIVRWQNAKPMLEATKIELPPEFDGHYAISVTGLPPQIVVMALNGRSGRGRGRGREGAGEQEAQTPEDPAARQKAMVDRLLHSAVLSAKGRDPQNADLVRQTGDKQSLIFGFQKQNLPLAVSDKDVQFVLKLGAMTLKAKFEPKEMTYKGELTV